jgi:hypothetical protein
MVCVGEKQNDVKLVMMSRHWRRFCRGVFLDELPERRTACLLFSGLSLTHWKNEWISLWWCNVYLLALCNSQQKESNFDLLGGGDIFLEPNWAFLRGLDDEVAFFSNSSIIICRCQARIGAMLLLVVATSCKACTVKGSVLFTYYGLLPSLKH